MNMNNALKGIAFVGLITVVAKCVYEYKKITAEENSEIKMDSDNIDTAETDIEADETENTKEESTFADRAANTMVKLNNSNMFKVAVMFAWSLVAVRTIKRNKATNKSKKLIETLDNYTNIYMKDTLDEDSYKYYKDNQKTVNSALATCMASLINGNMVGKNMLTSTCNQVLIDMDRLNA